MKFSSSNRERARLRRNDFSNGANKSQFKGKKSLSKRIIAERVGGITKDNVDYKMERLGCMAKSDEMLAQIMYHVKFGMDAYSSTFNEYKIEEILNAIKDLQVRLDEGNIDAIQYLDNLEDIDKQIMDAINTLSQCKDFEFDLSTK